MEHLLKEYFEMVIYQYLYHNELYPKEAFELRNKYGIAVYFCKNSKVNFYVQTVLASVLYALERKIFTKLVLFQVHCNEFEHELQQSICMFAEVKGSLVSSEEDHYWIRYWEKQFAENLLALTQKLNMLRKPRINHDDASYRFVLYTKNGTLNEDPTEFEWQLASELIKRSKDSIIVPVRSHQDGKLNMELTLEQF